MKLILAILLVLATAGCTFSIQDTPELRDKVAAYNSGNPIPDLPSGDVEPCLDIKGNINAQGEHIYHMPGQANYENTDPEAWFCTEQEAQDGGYRKSKS